MAAKYVLAFEPVNRIDKLRCFLSVNNFLAVREKMLGSNILHPMIKVYGITSMLSFMNAGKAEN